MRKLNATLLNGTNKEDAILKIKDESFAIDTNEQIIKIAYSNIKSYEYDDSEEILTIVKFGGNPIKLNIVKDRQLLELLSNLVIQNKNNKQKVDIADIESASLKEKNTKSEENTTINNTITQNKDVKQLKETEKQNLSNDNQNNSNDSNIFKTISGIISIITLVIIFVNMCSNGARIEGGYEAERYALKEIPESVLTLAFEPDVTSNELKCEAKEKTDDEIILVKCTTTNEHIIDYYESEIIWYAYQETADGMSHYRSINPDKDTALKNIRNKK